tara:strand:+ start:1039 stop:1212 length:174 start_codon:yes stop_codon:yes gene_type:complete
MEVGEAGRGGGWDDGDGEEDRDSEEDNCSLLIKALIFENSLIQSSERGVDDSPRMWL